MEETKKQRALRRRSRERNAVPVAAIVGYTNAGKSTLLNLLSDSDVLAEDKLFATLDPVTRNIKLPNGGEVLITDTVGFINKLPTDLVEAFQSTLEEAAYADIILHVCDISAPYMREQMRVVEEVLDSIGAGDKPTLHVYNKTDKLEAPFSPGSGTRSVSAPSETVGSANFWPGSRRFWRRGSGRRNLSFPIHGGTWSPSSRYSSLRTRDRC